MIDQLKPLFGKFTNFAQNKMGFDRPPKLFLKQDQENAKGCLGNTAHYDPQDNSIIIFITGRHPKDILRSYAHELVHHTQNLRGDLTPEKCGQMTDKYAQENPHMRKMEEEAYLMGNMCFRDWEDNEKFTLQESKLLKENNDMTKRISRSDLKEMIAKVISEKTKRAGHQVQGRPVPDDRVKPLEEEGDLDERGEEGLDPHTDDDPDPDSRMSGGHESDLTPDGAAAGWGVGPMDLAGLDEEDLVNIIRDASARLAANEEGNEPMEEDIGEDAEAGLEKAAKDLENTQDQAETDVVQSLTPASAKRTAKMRKMDPKGAKYDDDLFMKEEEEIEEGDEIDTPEKENTLYESRFAKRNANLFEDLVKKWAK